MLTDYSKFVGVSTRVCFHAIYRSNLLIFINTSLSSESSGKNLIKSNKIMLHNKDYTILK